MRLFHALRTGVRLNVLLAAALCLCAQEQATPGQDARPKEAQGLPPRVAPTDYQAHAKAGAVTIAAEFVGHAVPTAQGPLSTEDFVVVETALFGPPQARAQISLDDFSLRIDGKKTPVPSQPYGLILSSLKDPEWVPPETETQSKSKTSFGSGGSQREPGSPPPVVKIPIEVQRAMAQRAQKAALPLGDRVLPQAGLIFFPYRGKTQNIKSLELIYTGSAGTATLTLQP